MLASPVKKPSDQPGMAHYLIHSYDYPPIAAKGMTAARRDAEVAPPAPHALHMLPHIFARVCVWQDSVATNERSATAAKAKMEFVDQIHAMDYFEYAYLQLGRDAWWRKRPACWQPKCRVRRHMHSPPFRRATPRDETGAPVSRDQLTAHCANTLGAVRQSRSSRPRPVD